MSIYFHIPDFTGHIYLNSILINTVNESPEYFHDGLKIASVFGNFYGSVWNGGRYLGGSADIESVRRVVKVFNDKGVPLRFTLTNPLIKKEHLGDSFSNQMLRAANNGFNEVIVFSPLLEEYIRENYPDYKITSSTCKQIKDISGVNEELKNDYKYVVLDYNFNNKFEDLEQIDPKDRERCEILVNACCTPNCPRRGEHYRQIGQEQINEWEHKKNLLNKKPYESKPFECEFMKWNVYDAMAHSTHITPEDILEKYVPMGFVNFKIEGRTTPDINLLETYIYYMVKPEFQNKMRFAMLSALTRQHKHFMG